MKLSEAIRRGALLLPQCYNRMFVLDFSSNRPIEACVLGAAMIGYYGQDFRAVSYANGYTSNFPALFPELHKMILAPPCLHGYGFNQSIAHSFISIIMALNDEVRWTREAIADFVENIELEPNAGNATQYTFHSVRSLQSVRY